MSQMVIAHDVVTPDGKLERALGALYREAQRTSRLGQLRRIHVDSMLVLANVATWMYALAHSV